MYSVKQVSKMLDISMKTVYRYIDKMKIENINGFDIMSMEMSTDMSTEFKPKYTINSVGLDYIKSCIGFVDTDNCNSSVSSYNSDSKLIDFLQEQLKLKDDLLIEKDKQIALLLKQSENYQLLLANSQKLLSNNDLSITSANENTPINETVPKHRFKWWKK